MDISLLSQLIKELLPTKGQITLPRIGVFRTETRPAWFSEDGRVINPPSKKILFTQVSDQSDDTLIREYAAKIGSTVEELEEQSGPFFSGLLSEKNRTGSIVFPGFGKLVFTDDGTAAFEPFGTQDPFSGLYGLEPLTLKKIDSADPEEYLDLPGLLYQPGQEQAPAAPPAPVPLPGPTRKTHRGWIIAASILLGVSLIAAAVLLLGRSGSLDSFLYSEEELQLIESAGAGR